MLSHLSKSSPLFLSSLHFHIFTPFLPIPFLQTKHPIPLISAKPAASFHPSYLVTLPPYSLSSSLTSLFQSSLPRHPVDLELYYKSRHKHEPHVRISYTQKGGIHMAANNYHKYDEDFKKSLVSLHQNGKTQAQLCKEYGVSQSALGKWVKQYSTVEMDDGDVLTAKQVKELQKRNAQLEEENLILKKAIAIFTPHSNND